MTKDQQMTKDQIFRRIYALAGKARFVAQLRSDRIFLSKIVSGKAMSLDIMFVPGGLEIKPAVYRYTSGNAHFDYSQSEFRWARRKSVFLAVVKLFKKADLWGNVLDKDFFVPNQNNKKAISQVKKFYNALEL